MTPAAHASEMSYFLKSCAYGAAGGAIIGLASVALSEDPDANKGNIARGASLGLYAGIGLGLYSIYGAHKSTEADYAKNHFWISPIQSEKKLVGAQVNWMSLSF